MISSSHKIGEKLKRGMNLIGAKSRSIGKLAVIVETPQKRISYLGNFRRPKATHRSSSIATEGLLGGGHTGRTRLQTHHDPREDASVTPALPAVVEGLGRAIFLGRITPTQVIVIDEYYAAQNAPIVAAGLAMALRKERFQTLHLRLGQPVNIAHRSGLLAGPATRQKPEINGSGAYIGLGKLMGGIKSHFENSLFDFMQSLSGTNFDFYFSLPKHDDHPDYYKRVEWQMLEAFSKKFGGNGNGVYPILNNNAGSKRQIEDKTDWWFKPLKDSGTTPRWKLEPTARSQFARLD